MVNPACLSPSWGVHHVKIIAHNLARVRELFVERFLFEERLRSTCGNAVVVERGQARFLLQKLDGASKSPDGVSDIALECSSVDSLVKKVAEGGGNILEDPNDWETDDGIIRRAVVQSAVPSVQHTILDTSAYRGIFLPGFRPWTEERIVDSSAILNRFRFDHVALACDVGASESIIKWYERCFGMKRFPVSSTETEEEGFIVKHGSTGMRLKALNYWRCMETGVESVPGSDFKMVITEPLSHSGPNQISTFLKENGGQGVQHIALLTDDIISVAKSMKSAGLPFMRPPDAYYEEVNELQMETSSERTLICDLDLKRLKDSCILMDIETKEDQICVKDSSSDDVTSSIVSENILYQVFTKPLFDQDTFFMEIIQRNGATGFGAANIQALWKAVDIYMSSKQKI